MVVNQAECSTLEQRSVIKCLVVNECKLCEIDRRVWDVYGEICLSFKMFTKGLNMSFLRRTEVEKAINRVKTHQRTLR